MDRAQITDRDLRRMWTTRTWFLVAQLVAQGTQYLAIPSRPLHADQYVVLRPLGVCGWQAMGVLVLLTAALIAAVEVQRVRTPRWLRGWVFGAAGTLLSFLFAAAMLNGFYVAATLILPVGLCLAEVDQAGRIRDRMRRRHGDGARACG